MHDLEGRSGYYLILHFFRRRFNLAPYNLFCNGMRLA